MFIAWWTSTIQQFKNDGTCGNLKPLYSPSGFHVLEKVDNPSTGRAVTIKCLWFGRNNGEPPSTYFNGPCRLVFKGHDNRKLVP